MTIYSKRLPMLALLVSSLTLVSVASGQAQDRHSPTQGSTSATIQINFGTTLHWLGIGDSRVEELPAAERPDYDMFRYGGTYYVYNNNRWYSSPRERGEYTVVDDRALPNEFSSIPRAHWRNYPQTWQDRGQPGADAPVATLQVNLNSSPHWAGIHGTRVEELPAAERPNYDMFRYDGTYYVHNNNRWYMSRTGSGEYAAMDDRSVPGEFSNIPRDHWRNYPSGWRDQQVTPPRETASLQIQLRSSPRWTNVRGTRVQLIRERERPDYDMFRYGGSYFVFKNDHWYTSRNSNGRFMIMDDRNIPNELSRVPHRYWRNYPAAWMDENGNPRSENQGRRRY